MDLAKTERDCITVCVGQSLFYMRILRRFGYIQEDFLKTNYPKFLFFGDDIPMRMRRAGIIMPAGIFFVSKDRDLLRR